MVAELDQQVRSWRRIQELRRYCDALEARIADADDDEPVEEARHWLARARKYAELMDQLLQLPVTPEPKVRPEDLESYLDGWSSRGTGDVGAEVARSESLTGPHACRSSRNASKHVIVTARATYVRTIADGHGAVTEGICASDVLWSDPDQRIAYNGSTGHSPGSTFRR